VLPAVVIRNRRTGFEVVALLSEDSPEVTGYGGWEEVERRRRRGFPDWTKQPLYRMTVPMILEGWSTNTPQDRAIRGLENMARRVGTQRPPTVKLDGPVPHSDLVWVVESLDWGDALKDENGQVLRQLFSMTLMEWVDADLLAKRKRGRDGHGRGGKRFAVVKRRGKGSKARAETLMELCARVLRDSSRWREVAKLNKITHPRKLKVGRKIRLP
jgi:hypothetical protein